MYKYICKSIYVHIFIYIYNMHRRNKVRGVQTKADRSHNAPKRCRFPGWGFGHGCLRGTRLSAQWGSSTGPPRYHDAVMYEGFLGESFIGPPWCREALVSRKVSCKVCSLQTANNHQREGRRHSFCRCISYTCIFIKMYTCI